MPKNVSTHITYSRVTCATPDSLPSIAKISLATSKVMATRKPPRLVRRGWVWLLATLIWPSVAAAQTVSRNACDLVRAAELEATIGGQVTHPLGRETPYRENSQIDHDGVLYECSEGVGTWNVSVKYSTSQVTAEARKAGLVRTIEMQDAMRKDGYQVQTKDINGSKCSVIVESANPNHPEANVLIQTACQLEKGLYFVSITVRPIGSRVPISMEKVASLAGKAASRLPAH